MHLADLLFGAGDLDGTRQQLESAAEILLAAPDADPLEAGKSLNNLAYVLAAQGKDDAAVATYFRAIEHYRSKGHDTAVLLATTHENLAESLARLGRDDEAVNHLRASLEIFDLHPADNAGQIDDVAGRLAQFLRDRQDDRAAEAMYRKVIAARTALYGEADHRVVAAMTRLAGLLEDQERFEEAEELHREGMALYRKSLGDDHYTIGWKHLDLAELYRAQGRDDEAQAAFRDAEPYQRAYLAAREAELGEDSPELAGVLIEIGRYYRFDIAEPETARRHFARALAIREKALGLEDPGLLGPLRMLAGTYQGQKLYAEAEPHHRRVLELAERQLGADDPGLISNLKELAYDLNEQGRHQEADRLLERALAITLGREGPQALALADRFNDLAILAGRREDAGLAENRILEAVEIYRLAGQYAHPKVVSWLVYLARVIHASGASDKAASYALEAMRVAEVAEVERPADDRVLARAIVAESFFAEPAIPQVEALYQALAQQYGRLQESGENGRALLLYDLGKIYQDRGELARAEKVFRQSIAAYRETGGSHPDWIAPQLLELAWGMQQQGRLDEGIDLAEEAMALLRAVEPLNLLQLVKSESQLGSLLLAQEDLDRALRTLTDAFGRSQSLEPARPRLASRILADLAGVQSRRGEPRAALASLHLGLTELEAAFGNGDSEYGEFLGQIALLKDELGETEEAERTLKQAIALARENDWIDSARGATLVDNFGAFLSNRGRPREAVEVLERSLAIREEDLAPNDLRIADSLILLGDVEQTLGRERDAAARFERALKIRESQDAPDENLVVWALERLAGSQFNQGYIDEADTLYRRALALWESGDRVDNEGLGRTLGLYAVLLQAQGRYAESERMARRALAAQEAAFGEASLKLTGQLANLVRLYLEMGRSFDAAEHQLRAIAILESQSTPNPAELARSLIELAVIQSGWNEKVETIALLERSRGLLEQAEAKNQLAYAAILLRLGYAYIRVKQFDKAEMAVQEARKIQEDAIGDATLGLRMQLASLKLAKKEFDQALALFEGLYLDIKTRYGLDSPFTRTMLEAVPLIHLLGGRPEDAIAMFDETLGESRGFLQEGHPLEAFFLLFRGLVELSRDRPDRALGPIAKASESEKQNILRAAEDRSGSSGHRTYSLGLALALNIALLDRLAAEEPEQRDIHLAQAFELAQVGDGGSAAGALARMAARFGAGSDRLGQVVRARQDRLEQWKLLSRKLATAAAQPLDQRDLDGEADVRQRINDLDGEMRELDRTIERDFPDYATLVRPGAVPLADVQALLGPDEALLFLSVGKKAPSPSLEEFLRRFLPARTTIWLVRKNAVELHWVDLDDERVDEAVTRIRATLDPTGLFIRDTDDVPAFEQDTAFALYRALFAPVEPRLRGLRNLFVVPSGALQSLPLGVLLTKPPRADIGELADYRDLPWLARDHAMTTLPSVSSLRALRRFAKSSRPKFPFTGFGDPVLEGDPGGGRGLNMAAFFRGAVANVAAVRELPALPDSEQELQAMAAVLEAPESAVFLRAAATETQVKSMDLSESRILAFATHGLVAGELDGNAEPALVLTPPETGSELDDGLLTASEIAQLKLNADWVILSACNTASGSKPGAEGLSGLARAFFYAGSRALLVSHWPVVSDAAVKLTTNMLQLAQAEKLTRAEALQRSLLALMDDPDRPYYAHPMFWAPFTVVGEGGAFTQTP